ncbi:hypothetical protein [Marinimicrobium sp. C6131]|uniref:hypothetical protein n=1 Tax=Marinimicrobium TaxID=359337 RepID=UPI00223DBDFF|nr:hypothetical protein [Marinimicrobium sp. C6131]UZJ43424.1 hypothetical protein OOT55_12255 [Marinimicrobium sp. C6131]
MSRGALILFLMLVAVANLVFAADWHDLAAGDTLALEQVANADRVVDADYSEHSHPPGGSCVHAHSCHAHAHLFFVATGDFGSLRPTGHRWQAEHLPLPPQFFMAPDVPPPIA